jgi:hypothetical protein
VAALVNQRLGADAYIHGLGPETRDHGQAEAYKAVEDKRDVLGCERAETHKAMQTERKHDRSHFTLCGFVDFQSYEIEVLSAGAFGERSLSRLFFVNATRFVDRTILGYP